MDSPSKARLCCSQRLTLSVLSFFGKFFVYSARVNLSVAILCMVRSDVTSNNNTLSVLDFDNSTDYGQDQISTTDDRGEFDWDKSTQSIFLSMYFYGYICTQIPGGWLSSRFGGKRVWGFCQLVSAICTLLTPISARTHFYFACAVRFILGFSAGVTFPSVYALMGRWAPPLERSKLLSLSFSGPPIANVLTLVLAGVLCEYGFDNGWGSIFYLCGIFHMIWVLAWFYLTADSPDEHKRISTKERLYIKNAIGKGNVNRKTKVPWTKIFTSGPVWAIVVAHFCTTYTSYTLLTSLPLYMKEALKFDIKQNGALSAMPYLVKFVVSSPIGFVADKVVERRWLPIKATRKIFQAISFLGPAAMFCILVQIDSSQRYVAVVLICLSTLLSCTNRGGYIVNHLDLAPSYAGILFGISNTAATIPGMIAPLIAGALTPNKTSEEWRLVFYVCAAVAVLGCLVYIIMGDAELQEWSVTKDELRDVVNIDKNYPNEDNGAEPILETKFDSQSVQGSNSNTENV